MPIVRGLEAFQAMRQAFDKQQGQGLRFVLKAGETALVRFYGDFEGGNDPVIGKIHYVKRLPPGKQYNNCGDNAESNPGCVFCLEKSRGDKGIGQGARAYFQLKDFRRYHQLDQEVRILKPGVVMRPGKTPHPDDFITTKYPSCRAPNRVCEFCRNGSEAKVSGLRYWELSTSYAEQLISQQATLRNFCKCGAIDEDGVSGTIRVAQYLCAHCNEPVEFYPERGIPLAGCNACGRSLPPLEEIACTACENPQRCDIPDFMWRVKRTGEGTDTTYNFEAVQPCKPPTEEELAEAEAGKPNWEEMLAPQPPEQQAALLGLPSSPFQTPGHGAGTYKAQGQHVQAPKASAPPQAPKKRVDVANLLRKPKISSSKPALPKPGAPKLSFKAPKLLSSAQAEDDEDISY